LAEILGDRLLAAQDGEKGLLGGEGVILLLDGDADGAGGRGLALGGEGAPVDQDGTGGVGLAVVVAEISGNR
jgi:hypothetical protein